MNDPRRLLGLLLIGVAGCTPTPVQRAPAPNAGVIAARDWELYRQRFLSSEGRNVDQGATHSESQGFALLLAEAHGDRPLFDQLWRWTQEHLQVREDHLFAWQWRPEVGVEDFNDASDGDLLIAWALARGAARWEEEAYRVSAREILADIRGSLLRPSPHGLLLLPGVEGFDKPDSLTINLSYWVFPALRACEEIDPSPRWSELVDSGLALLERARFGRWQLPPDWLQVEPTFAIARDLQPRPEPRFGYDAVRIPLYLVWGGLGNRHRLEPFLAYWDHFRGASFLSPWTDLEDNSIASDDAPQGIHAIAALSREAVGLDHPPPRPLDDDEDYYSSSLVLLARLARREGL